MSTLVSRVHAYTRGYAASKPRLMSKKTKVGRERRKSAATYLKTTREHWKKHIRVPEEPEQIKKLKSGYRSPKGSEGRKYAARYLKFSRRMAGKGMGRWARDTMKK